MPGRQRRDRRRAEPADSWTGRRFETDVLRVAHGGHCVARHEGRVIFVRHALPGERVVVEITDDGGGSFCRGDAVEILTPRPDRVTPPCEYARPGGCGGCDWQHAAPAAQRELKRAVIAEQLSRLAGVDWDGVVEPVEPLQGWRTRMQYAVATRPQGAVLGLRRHRSHEIVEIAECLIAAEAAQPAVARRARDSAGPEARHAVTVEVAGLGPDVSVDLVDRRGRRTHLAGQETAPEVGTRRFDVPPGGFWQVHPRAAEVLSDAVLELAAPETAERVLDLYSGVGLFAALLAERVGESGEVVAVEGHPGAAAAAGDNLADLPGARAVHAPVTADTIAGLALDRVDIVVLDPPRAGARREVCEAIDRLAPRVIVYVACDPAALARDAAVLAEHGWRMRELRAFDLFPMTHHVECVAAFEPGPNRSGSVRDAP